MEQTENIEALKKEFFKKKAELDAFYNKNKEHDRDFTKENSFFRNYDDERDQIKAKRRSLGAQTLAFISEFPKPTTAKGISALVLETSKLEDVTYFREKPYREYLKNLQSIAIGKFLFDPAIDEISHFTMISNAREKILEEKKEQERKLREEKKKAGKAEFARERKALNREVNSTDFLSLSPKEAFIKYKALETQFKDLENEYEDLLNYDADCSDDLESMLSLIPFPDDPDEMRQYFKYFEPVFTNDYAYERKNQLLIHLKNIKQYKNPTYESVTNIRQNRKDLKGLILCLITNPFLRLFGK